MTEINQPAPVPKIIVIVGPTASGKSDLAISLARNLKGEIISADSRQVYRGMDIGTGKVTKKEQKMAVHHLIDVASPKKQFTADDFMKLAEKSIKNILSRDRVPIIVGGTGFYIDILLGRMDTAQVPANKKLRAELAKQTAEQLFKKLLRLDPARAKTIDRHNKHRLIRALEITMTTNKSSAFNSQFEMRKSQYDILWLGINPGKEKLAENIKMRLDKRLRQGMIKEVVDLHKKGVSWKKLDSFGLEYRQISRYLQSPNPKHQITNFKKSEYYKKLLSEITKYSKRQMTWFKRNEDIHWLKDIKTAGRLARRFMT
jgi:tRNA dimethylallyltransferase